MADILDLCIYNLSNVRKLSSDDTKGEIIGKGAISTVFLAKDIDEGLKYFAIKEISKEQLLLKNVKLEIIYKEIEIHSSLNHPNIIKLHSYEENEENFQLLMDYQERGSLHSYIQTNKGRISELQAYHFFIQILSAVSFLHKNDIIHRDIKPENILLDQNLNVKLCDFGWAVKFGVGFRETFCGTFEYMAPEIVNEVPYDFQIDVWSLGVLLYEILHGYSPFKAESNHHDPNVRVEQIFKNISEEEIVFGLEISEQCKDLINKLLTKNSRYRIKLSEIYNHKWIINGKLKAEPKRGTIVSSSTVANSKNFSVNSINVGQSNNRLGSLMPKAEFTSLSKPPPHNENLANKIKSPALNIRKASFNFSEINLKKFEKSNYSQTEIISGSFDNLDSKLEESMIDKVIKKVNTSVTQSKPRKQSVSKMMNISANIAESNANRKKLSTFDLEAVPMYEEENSIDYEQISKGQDILHKKKLSKFITPNAPSKAQRSKQEGKILIVTITS